MHTIPAQFLSWKHIQNMESVNRNCWRKFKFRLPPPPGRPSTAYSYNLRMRYWGIYKVANNLCPRYTYCIYIHQATVMIRPPFCLLVGRLVGWSVGWLVGRSVGWLAGRAVNISLKGYTSMLLSEHLSDKTTLWLMLFCLAPKRIGYAYWYIFPAHNACMVKASRIM